MKPFTENELKEARKLAILLPLVMGRCHNAGLYITGHAMHEAVRAIGWEIADRIPDAKKTKKRGSKPK